MSATLKPNVSSPQRCLVAPTLPTAYVWGRMARFVSPCSLAPNVPIHTFPYDPQEFKFRDAHQRLRRQVSPFMDLKEYMLLTIHLSGHPLPRLRVRCRWQTPRRSQPRERVHFDLDRASREQKGGKPCTPTWRYLTASLTLHSYFIRLLIGHFDPHETALRNPKIQPDVRTAVLLEIRSVLNAFFTR